MSVTPRHRGLGRQFSVFFRHESHTVGGQDINLDVGGDVARVTEVRVSNFKNDMLFFFVVFFFCSLTSSRPWAARKCDSKSLEFPSVS